MRNTRPNMKDTKESGAALMWVAGSLVALLAVSSFAIDLGWYYLNASRVQRAADAAALAGVVHLPGFVTEANTDAVIAATTNFAGSTLNPAPVAHADNRYQVFVRATIPSFFARIVGWNNFTVTRSATAEYVKPVRMGSPFNNFGNGNDASQNFWAAINGPRTGKQQGDPFAPQCLNGNSCSSNTNTQYRSNGYYYAVEIPSGKTSMTVDLYDPGYYRRTGFGVGTGDVDSLSETVAGGVTTTYTLRSPDSTPLDPTDNPAVGGTCTQTWAPITDTGYPSNTSNGKDNWRAHCTVASPIAGIYYLQVSSSGTTGGSNHFAIRATTVPSTGAIAKVYGALDMSIFTNDVLGTDRAVLHLAEVPTVHAGKRLEIKLFDPGEGSGNAYMTLRTPSGATPTCDWTAWDESVTSQITSRTDVSCRIQTTVSGTAQFNSRWVIINIDIPSNYSCTTNCWWTLLMEIGTPHDRTTWQARIVGNPVRLVPNP